MTSTFSINGIHFFSGSLDNVISIIQRWIDKKNHHYICVTSVHGLVESQRNKVIYKIYQHAGLIVPDGMPLVWFGKLIGNPHTQRIYGPNLMKKICQVASREKISIFLYGTDEQTLQKLKKNLRV